MNHGAVDGVVEYYEMIDVSVEPCPVGRVVPVEDLTDGCHSLRGWGMQAVVDLFDAVQEAAEGKAGW